MKKLVSVLLAVCLLAGLAVFAGAAGEKIRLTDHFTFDMTPSEMLAKAEELGFRPLMPGEIKDWDIDYYDQIEAPEHERDGRQVNWDDSSFAYFFGDVRDDFFDGFFVQFSSQGEMNELQVRSDRFETGKGISVGDSSRDVKKAHPFAKSDGGYYWFVYNNKKELTRWFYSRRPQFTLLDLFSLAMHIVFVPIELFLYYICFGWLWMK